MFFSSHSLPQLNSWQFHASKGSGPKLEGHPQLLLLFSYLCSVFQQIQWARSSKHIQHSTVSAPPWLPPLPVLTTTIWHWNNHGTFLASTLASLKAVLHLVATRCGLFLTFHPMLCLSHTHLLVLSQTCSSPATGPCFHLLFPLLEVLFLWRCPRDPLPQVILISFRS